MKQDKESAVIICNPENLRNTQDNQYDLIKKVWGSSEIKKFSYQFVYTKKKGCITNIYLENPILDEKSILDSEEDFKNIISELKNQSTSVSIYYAKNDTDFDSYIKEKHKGEESYNECDIKIINISETGGIDFDKPEWLVHDTSNDINDNIKFWRKNCYKVNGDFSLYAERELLEDLKVLVQLKKTIFVIGERGSGKTTTIEKAVKALLNIEDEKFVSVACGNLDKNLARDELFGHVKGAYTGADKDKKGFVEKAEGGCLYLDEIQDLSKEIQRMLIKGIEDHKFYKVGSEESYESNFQLICSSNRPLSELKDKLWDDFYDRISIFQIKIPSIEEQKSKDENFISICLPGIWDNYKKKCSNTKFFDSYDKLNHQIKEKIISALKGNTLLGNFRDIEKLLAYIERYALNGIVDIKKGENYEQEKNENINIAISEWEFLIKERNSHLPDAIPSQLTDDFIKKQNWKALNRMFKTWLAEQAVRIYGSEYKAAKKLHVDKNTIHNNLPENQNDMIETED